MNNRKEVSIVLALAAMLLLAGLAGAYEYPIKEGIFLVRPDNSFIDSTGIPHYLQNEDLIFFACLEKTGIPIHLSVLCTDNNQFEDVQAYRWGPDNCYIGATNLQNFDCTQAVVQADYVQDGENLQLTQPIRINKFSNTLNRIVQTQYSDGGWQTPLDTAYGLFVIAHFPNIFEQRIQQAIEYLKLNRDQKNKCWPASGCKISTTANILFLLNQAGFSDLRIQHDAALYLQHKQNYLSGAKWNIVLGDHILNQNNSVNTSCVFDYQDSPYTLNLSKYPANTTINLTPVYDAHIGIVCTENVYVTLYNRYNESLLRYQGDNFSYTIPGACWTLNDENISCDVRSTLFAANDGLASSQTSAAKSYLASILTTDRLAGKKVGLNATAIDDALYLVLKGTSSNDVLTSVLYHQQNLGGWQLNRTYYKNTYFEASPDQVTNLYDEITDNVSKDIVATGYSIMGLIANGYNRSDEPVVDAERWVSLMEDQTGLNYTDKQLTDAKTAAAYAGNKSLILNDTKRNAMAFYVLENNARPLLQAKPRIVIMDRPTVAVDVVNPTIFDLNKLTYKLSSNLQSQISVDEKDSVSAYSFRRIQIHLKTDTPTADIGYLRILEGNNEYLKLPIIVESTPHLNITLPKRITVFGSTAILPFTIDKSAHNFTCSLEWNSTGISSGSAFDINGVNGTTYNYPVQFAKLETENAIYGGTITCSANLVTFVIPFATNVVRFSSRPLHVTPTYLSVNDSLPQTVTVENMLDQSVDVEMKLVKQDPLVVLSDPYFTLYPGESKNVSVQVIPDKNSGYNTTNAVVFSTYGVENRVVLDVNIHPPGPGFLSGWVLWGLLAVLVVLGGAGAYFGYRYREAIGKWYDARFRKEDSRFNVFKKVSEMETQEEQVAIRNMIRILKLQGLKDTEVRQRLQKDGYSAADIDAALTTQEDAGRGAAR